MGNEKVTYEKVPNSCILSLLYIQLGKRRALTCQLFALFIGLTRVNFERYFI